MQTHVHLRVDQPCSENWDAMLPEENGRFCGSCAKTVVDFSQMSDQQVIDYLGRAGQHVCGRFASDQLERPLPLSMPQPKKQRIGWWHLLLAGVLFSGKASAQSPAVKPTVEAKASDTVFKTLPEVVVLGYGKTTCRHISMGPVSSSVSDCEPLYGLAGGLSYGIRIQRSILEKVKDSLQLPFKKKELTIYPNPVRKGMTVTISWQLEAGEYSVGLYTSSGALVQQKIMQVTASSQIDLYAIPSSLANGIYFVRIARAGGTKVYTRKVEVL